MERLKAEGKYMTAKQKEAKRRAEQMLEAMKAQGEENKIEPWNGVLKWLYNSDIWQGPEQHCCEDAYKISGQSYYSKPVWVYPSVLRFPLFCRHCFAPSRGNWQAKEEGCVWQQEEKEASGWVCILDI